MSLIAIKKFYNKFGLFKNARREYYECGFKPFLQKPLKLSFHFFVICILFLIYDVELVFSLPFISSTSYNGYYDLFNFILLYGTFFFSIFYDSEKGLFGWKFF